MGATLGSGSVAAGGYQRAWLGRGKSFRGLHPSRLLRVCPRSTSPWPESHYKKNKLKASCSGSTVPSSEQFYLCQLKKEGWSIPFWYNWNNYPLNVIITVWSFCRQKRDRFQDFLLLVGTFCKETAYVWGPPASDFRSRWECAFLSKRT